MHGIYDGFQIQNTDGREIWFAGANTDSGFIGSYPDIIDEARLERVYIIKGGSGTGKSTLMRRLGADAEALGYPVAYYLCGSDPDSLDAVVIDDRIAMLDGTAPHVLDMKYPGAASSLVDVSRFWDSGILERRREEIEGHCAVKSAEYASAYRWLGAAEKLAAEEDVIAVSLFEREKALEAIHRLVKRLPKSCAVGSIRHRYTHGITMRGCVSLPTIAQGADNRYVIEDQCGAARLFLPMLANALVEAGFRPTIGHLPLGNRITGIRAGTASFTVGRAGEGDAAIRMSRFVKDGGDRGQLRLTAKLRESCVSEAANRLSAAAEHHFALEEIYKPAMDFDALEAYGQRVRREILDRLAGKE